MKKVCIIFLTEKWLCIYVFAAVNVSARQSILVNSIGAYPEETFAYQKILVMITGYPLLLILATFAQFYCYQIYNESKHPFKKLVKRSEKIVKIELKSLLEENDEYTNKRGWWGDGRMARAKSR